MIAKSTCQTFIYSGSGKGETNNRNNSDCDFKKIKGKKELETAGESHLRPVLTALSWNVAISLSLWLPSSYWLKAEKKVFVALAISFPLFCAFYLFFLWLQSPTTVPWNTHVPSDMPIKCLDLLGIKLFLF